MIKKVNKEIGKVGSTTVKTAVITNLLTSDKSKGIRIEKPSTKQYGSDAIAFIDEDEIDGLLKSIQLIKEEIAPVVPSDYTEVSFKSRSGFEAGCFVSKEKWSYYLKIDKYNSDSYHFLKDGDLDKFESLIKEAKSKLSTL
jgi:hypothetical protein